MTRVTFGDTCSPFLSVRTVQKHAEDYAVSYPQASKEIEENMYVDDVLTGSHDEDSALTLKEEMCELMESGGFKLTKWASNSQKMMQNIPIEERVPNLTLTPENVHQEKMSNLLKALGISWNTNLRV